MNAKNRKVPLLNYQYDAALRRINKNHPKRQFFEEESGKKWAGYKGEKILDYDLRFLPYQSNRILHDLRLFTYSKPFQMDTSILRSKLSFVVEAKNLAGRIFYEDGYFKQEVDQEIKTMEDPIIQVTRHQKQLQEWLRYRGFHGYPVIPLVAICNPTTIIDIPEGHTRWPIINSVHIIEKLQQLEKQYQNRKSVDTLPIQERLIAEHQPKDQNFLQNHFVSLHEIQRGVQCPRCSQYAMKFVKLRWQCPRCGFRSVDAHLQALADYFLLVKDSITNKECRWFLGVSSNQAYRLLSGSGLVSTGSKRGKVYHRPADIEILLSDKYRGF